MKTNFMAHSGILQSCAKRALNRKYLRLYQIGLSPILSRICRCRRSAVCSNWSECRQRSQTFNSSAWARCEIGSVWKVMYSNPISRSNLNRIRHQTAMLVLTDHVSRVNLEVVIRQT